MIVLIKHENTFEIKKFVRTTPIFEVALNALSFTRLAIEQRFFQISKD